MFALLSLAIVAQPAPADPLSADQRKALVTAWTAERNVADNKIKQLGETARELSRRGDAHFFLGDPVGALVDFDWQITVDPASAAGHWRRGIALYFAGRFEDSAKQ